MRPFLARFSEPVWSGHLASWADFITTTLGKHRPGRASSTGHHSDPSRIGGATANGVFVDVRITIKRSKLTTDKRGVIAEKKESCSSGDILDVEDSSTATTRVPANIGAAERGCDDHAHVSQVGQPVAELQDSRDDRFGSDMVKADRWIVVCAISVLGA
jgi:hypothetical protein